MTREAFVSRAHPNLTGRRLPQAAINFGVQAASRGIELRWYHRPSTREMVVEAVRRGHKVRLGAFHEDLLVHGSITHITADWAALEAALKELT